MSISGKTQLSLTVDHAHLEAKDNQAIIHASVLIRNHADEIANVDAANLTFELHADDGTKLTELKAAGSTQLQQINTGEEARWQGRCIAKADRIQRHQPYQLRVDGFGRTCTTHFEFS